MKAVLTILIASAAIGRAQSSGNGNSDTVGADKIAPHNGTFVVCTLENVTWNPQTEELSWVVSMRDLAAGKDQQAVQEKYTIHIDTATMSFKGEGRHFDPDEAHKVKELMDVISNYTVESTVWWSNGEGEKSNGNESAPPATKDKSTDKPKPAPPTRVPVPATADSSTKISRWLSESLQLQY
jgi:hypothetical protein